MDQVSTQKFENHNKKIVVICDSTTPLGDLHDFLLLLKGEIVDRMVKAQKQEEEIAKKQKEPEAKKKK